MGIHFKNFCDRQRKDKNGHVRDLLDMDTADKDAAVVAYLIDDNNKEAADVYMIMSEGCKNHCYQNLESRIRDAIDEYNAGVK